ncbi:amidohydrolase [Ottowia thiooxydans]|uniref:Amidohydrolase YtcJ n=1 Tax=Ottowia thiooxydans TaxID=219182 RepID=A0ABV2QCT5_9BURK
MFSKPSMGTHANRRSVLKAAKYAIAVTTFPVFLYACGGDGDHTKETADLVLKNGYVYTVDTSRSEAEAVAVKNGKILFVGKNRDADAYIGEKTQSVDLKGKMLLPGIVDSHNHVSDHPEGLFWLTTRPFTSMEKIGAALKEYRAKDPSMKQLRAIGWDVDMLKEASAESGLSPAQILDQYVPDIPVILLHDWHHDMWVNSLALENAGINENTPNPPGAFFERVAGTAGIGQPSGIVREFGAMSLILKALPYPDFTKAQFREAILDWQKMAAVRGVTSALVPQPRPTVNFYEALKELDAEGLLTSHFEVAVWADETRGTEQVPEILALREKYKGGNKFKLSTVKIFGTGSSAWEASDRPVWDQETLKQTVAALDKNGMRIFIHDIGPVESYNNMLDAFEYALKQNGPRDARHTITHVNEGDSVPTIERFKQLDIRADGHPAPKAFFDAGVKVTLSSDYPVVDFFPGRRIGRVVKSGVPVASAIAAHTIAGAELMFREKEIGSIEVGKSADLVVYDKSFFAMTAEEISAAKPVMTLATGKVVFRDASFSDNSK